VRMPAHHQRSVQLSTTGAKSLPCWLAVDDDRSCSRLSEWIGNPTLSVRPSTGFRGTCPGVHAHDSDGALTMSMHVRAPLDVYTCALSIIMEAREVTQVSLVSTHLLKDVKGVISAWTHRPTLRTNHLAIISGQHIATRNLASHMPAILAG
jgi:hypothetical protein